VKDQQIAPKALIPIQPAHLNHIVTFCGGQRAKQGLSLEAISPTSASPEADKPRVNSERKNAQPGIELRLSYTVPVEQIRSHKASSKIVGGMLGIPVSDTRTWPC
jgi:hypothetical protein